MEKYVYFTAQLPMLFFDRETWISITDFLYEAQKWLSPADRRILTDVSIDTSVADKHNIAVLQEYQIHEYALRSELQQYRLARRKGQEYKPSLFPLALIKEGNPLDVEKKLLDLRWQLLEELAFGHYADIEFLCLYYLKLQILERLKKFDLEIGREKFKTYTELAYEQE
jgi:hypothetical protein